MSTSSTALIQQVRQLINDTAADPANQNWEDSEIDAALVDGYGFVTYGERTETTANGQDTALAKLWAGATLCATMARSDARLSDWKAASGEEYKSGQIAANLNKLSALWYKQVEDAMKRDILRNAEGQSKSAQAEGAQMDWNAQHGAHAARKQPRLAKHNNPSDR
jgi:hypothetical protein